MMSDRTFQTLRTDDETTAASAEAAPARREEGTLNRTFLAILNVQITKYAADLTALRIRMEDEAGVGR